MHCTKCGKQLPEGSTDTLCEDCKKLENQPAKAAVTQTANVQPAPAEQANTRMAGFGQALTATILAVVAYIFVIYSYLNIINGALGDVSKVIDLLVDPSSVMLVPDLASSVITASIVCYIIAIALSIPAIILGVKSIVTFKKVSNQGGAKPIATLILGIAGMVLAILTILLALLTMCLTTVLSRLYNS